MLMEQMWCVCVCVNVCRSQRSSLGIVSPGALPLVLTGLFTTLAWNRLGLLIGELQRPTCLQLNPGTRIKTIDHQA